MSDTLNAKFEELGKTVNAFIAANDKRYEELKAGKNDPVLKAEVDKANAAIGEIQHSIAEIQKAQNRPGGPGGQDPKAAINAQHRDAFVSWTRRGEKFEDSLRALEAQASVNIGSDAAGGFAVPEELDKSIIELERDAAPMRGVCSVITVGNETYERLVNKQGLATGWVGETDARTETAAPTLASVKPYFGEVYANPMVSQKALDDMFFNPEAWLGSEIGLAMGATENTCFTSSTGNGTNKPKGILAYTLAETADSSRTFGQLEKLTTTTQGVIVGDELIKLTEKLKPGYRQNSRWMFGSTTAAYIRCLKDKEDNYLLRIGLELGQPDTLLGFPITRNEDVPAIANGAASAILGDFRRGYTIADVRGIRILRDPFSNKPYVGFYATKRVGGGVMDSLALKVLVVHA